MMSRSTCPCCSYPLLRHARHGEIYWFCPHCYQEMPAIAIFGDRLISPKTLATTSGRSDKVLTSLAK